MIEKEPRALAHGQRLTIDFDAVARPDVERGRRDQLAVDRNAPGRDPGLRLAARGKAGPRDHLGDALAGRRMLVLLVHVPYRLGSSLNDAA